MTRQEREQQRKAKFKPAYDALMKYYPLTLDDLDGEEWKTVEGWAKYRVSNFGRVKSFNKGNVKILTPGFVRGYLQVLLVKGREKKNFKNHRLVAEAFLPKEKGKDCVNHIDGHTLNNHVSNLEWCTLSENTQHAVKIGLMPTGEGNYQAGVSNENATKIRAMYKPFDKNFSTVALGKMFGLSDTSIGNILHGETYKTAGGARHDKNPLKIPVETRREIRQRYKAGGESLRSLAEEFSCSKTTIKRIVHEQD